MPLAGGRSGETRLLLPPTEARPLTPALADGGRLLESCRWRCDIAGLLLVSRPVRKLAEGALPVLPARPADRPRVFIVRTGMCEAPAAGAVRAMTERFITDEGGVETRPRAFAAPVKLALVGAKDAPLVTRAPRSAASVRCMEPRLMACPFTKALREAAVTALALCANR